MMRFLTIVFMLIVSTSIGISQETVFAEVVGLESGRGILKTRGSECFVIIPHHLIKDHFGTVSIYGEGSVLAESEFVKSYTSDLAILRLPSDAIMACTDWKLDREYNKVIDVVTKCRLEMRDKTGGVSTMAVNITGIDDQFIYVQPENFREKIVKGMSGSSLFTEYNGRKVYLGMLQQVDMNTGEVLMADEMENTLNEFFNPVKRISYNGSNEEASIGIVRESGEIRFELRDIERNGSNVTLKFDISSLDQDKQIYASYRDISLFDEKGLEYKPNRIQIGNQSDWNVRYNLVHGITVPMEVSFNSISSSATDISLLTYKFKSKGSDRVFQMRDIELPGGTSVGSQYDGNDVEGITKVSGFKFELKYISQSGQSVLCKFLVTSEERDKNLGMYYRDIFLYDDSGFIYNPKRITIGNKSDYNVQYNMIHGISIPVDLQFEGVNSSAEQIALLKVGFKANNVESEFQLRNLPMEGFAGTSDESNTNGKSNGACSEIYFYRMKGFLQCDEKVEVLNHGNKILALDQGTRYKTVVCDNRELDLKASIGQEELGFSSNKPNIELGTNYYFKIGCSIGVSKITLQDEQTGKAELNKKGKYKRDIQEFQFNAW